MAGEKYLLKILSGPNQGAEVALDAGELVVGSASDCDLILSDTLVSGHHLKVVVGENGVSIVPLESPVYFDGQEIAKDQFFTVEPFKFISIGTTHFVIGPTEGEWPALSSADIPNLTKMEKEEVKEEEANKEGESGGAGLATEESLKETKAVEEQGLKKLIKENQGLTLGGAGVLILMIIIGILGIYFGLKENEGSITPPSIIKEEISKVIASTGSPQAFTVEEEEGGFFIQGWAATSAEANKIEDALNKIAPNVIAEVRVSGQTVENLKDLLNGLGAKFVGVSAIEPGKFKLSGYYGDDSGWESVRSDIGRDVPGVRLLKDEVLTPRKLYPTLTKILDNDKIAGKVQYVPQKEGIILKGMISQTDVPKVKESIKHLQAEVGAGVPIKNQIVVAKPEDLYLDLDMDSVTIGKNGYIVTKGGQRLFEGGMLKGGYVIEKISRDGIILKKDDQEITLNLGENYD